MYLTVYQNCHTQIFLKYRGTRKSAISSFTDILQIRPTLLHTFDKQAYLAVQSLVRAFKKNLRGDNEIRTRDLLLARQALSQLSYTPMGSI